MSEQHRHDTRDGSPSIFRKRDGQSAERTSALLACGLTPEQLRDIRTSAIIAVLRDRLAECQPQTSDSAA